MILPEDARSLRFEHPHDVWENDGENETRVWYFLHEYAG
jgi:hypothetical protein